MAGGAHCCSSKKPKQPAAQQRDPPAGADKQPGMWLTDGFCAQLCDTVIQQVKKTARDPCTFNVYSSEGEVPSAWVWPLEAFTEDSVTGHLQQAAQLAQATELPAEQSAEVATVCWSGRRCVSYGAP